MNNKMDPLNRREEAILLLDNCDSFTYSLPYVMKESGATNVETFRNGEISLKEVERLDKTIPSPGPGIPEEVEPLLPIIQKYISTKNILKVCLEHQVIGETFGVALENPTEIYHSMQTPVNILKEGVLFRGLEHKIPVGRYHSWVVNRKDFLECLETTAESREEQIMTSRHHTYNVHGIQSHPESMLTPQGEEIIRNLLNQ